MAYRCFLSYARADADRYFERFVKDFSNELRGSLGVSTVDGLVFRDSDSIDLGAKWEAALEEALCVSQTFLAMVSPTYIRRPACSKEWAAFEWRLINVGATPQTGLLLPLEWIRSRNSALPPGVASLQMTHAAFGRTYAKHGLRCVVQNDGREYRRLLTALANQVCDLMHRHALPSLPQLPDPGVLPDPFATTTLAPISMARSAVGGGPKHVDFIVVAATQSEVRAQRSAVTGYGAMSDDWCPYVPVVETRVGMLVQKIALEEGLTAGFGWATQDLVAYLQEARSKNVLVVLVVDVWSLRLRAYGSCMKLFDRAERFVNAGVLVIWNFADSETRSRELELRTALQVAFPNLTVMKDPQAFHEQLASPDEFVDKLRATLCVLRRRVADLGQVMRKAEGDATIAKPQLVGPGSV